MILSIQSSLAQSAREIANQYLDTAGHKPPVLNVMLQNVRLNLEKHQPPLEQIGDFWFWKLSNFGLDLMLALSKSAKSAFSFVDSFLEKDPVNMLEFKLLDKMSRNLETNFDWDMLFLSDTFLQSRNIQIDVQSFKSEMVKIIKRMEYGIYDDLGNRSCLTIEELQRRASVR